MMTETEAVTRGAKLYWSAMYGLDKPEGEYFDSLDEIIDQLCECYAVTTNDHGEYFLPEAQDVARWHRLSAYAVRMAEGWRPPTSHELKAYGTCPCGTPLSGRQTRYCCPECKWRHSKSTTSGRPRVALTEKEVSDICDMYSSGMSMSSVRALSKRGGPVVRAALQRGGVPVRKASGERKPCSTCGAPTRRGHNETAMLFMARTTCSSAACAGGNA
tara:strand:- start:1771 stop:2418 length:648 start_codon:yes stop_codon:yes gene_type:complete